MDNLTVIQQLAAIRDASRGVSIQIKPFETILNLEIRGDQVLVLIETYSYEEGERRIRFKKHGKRLVSIDRNSGAVESITAWSPDFTPFDLLKYGQVTSQSDKARKRTYEQMCYRPGTCRNPLDSYSRVLDGPTTRDMEKYW